MLRLIAVCSLMLVGSLAVQAADSVANRDDVQRWIAKLDDDKFSAREDATRHLIMPRHKDAAIQGIVNAAEKGSPEARRRALHILSAWYRSGGAESRKAIVATAKRWQAAKNPRLVPLGIELWAKMSVFF